MEHKIQSLAILISGGSRGGAQGFWPPLILGEKRKSWKEEKTAGQANPPPPLTQGLDPPLLM